MDKLRLHLGCGLIHRPGWINLDTYATGAADVMADMILLPFADEQADAIICRQIVEHLGYVGTLYALYEWWRVLRPKGTLIIETTDRPVTFRAALEHETAMASLPWIFGSEQTGFGNRYLFDADELIHLVVEADFELVSVEHLSVDHTHPTLQLTAQRRPTTPTAQFTAQVHRAFVTSGLLDPTDAPQYLVTLETIVEQTRQFVTKPGRDSLAQLVNLSARYSPQVTQCILQHLPHPEAWQTEDLARAKTLAQELDALHFPARLAYHWRNIPKLPEKKESLRAILDREINFYLTASLFPGEGLDDVREAFNIATSDLSPTDMRIHFFSEETLNDLALHLAAQGVRAFARNELDTSVQYLELAISYQPNLIWPRWNLARLYLVLDRPLEALGLYDSIQPILPERLKPAFERELHAVTEHTRDLKVFLTPLVELRELLAPVFSD